MEKVPLSMGQYFFNVLLLIVLCVNMKAFPIVSEHPLSCNLKGIERGCLAVFPSTNVGDNVISESKMITCND